MVEHLFWAPLPLIVGVIVYLLIRPERAGSATMLFILLAFALAGLGLYWNKK